MKSWLDIGARSGRFGCLTILIYHRVLSEPDPLRPAEMTVAQFNKHLSYLKKYFRVLSLSEGVGRLQEGNLAPNSVVITFDDGYQDNLDNALPLLQQFGMHATFFITTGFLEQGLMFNDQIIEMIRHYHKTLHFENKKYDCTTLTGKHKAISHLISSLKYQPLQDRQRQIESLFEKQALPRLMLSPEGVQSMAKSGMGIGAHTAHHPILQKISDDEAFQKIKQSKDALENLLQYPIQWFAYPNGKKGIDFSERHVRMIRQLDFKGALSTDWGVGFRSTSHFCLPRFTPWTYEKLKFLSQMCRVQWPKPIGFAQSF